jgi:putative tryptophan/tyrosine transport system substrate-binding protein
MMSRSRRPTALEAFRQGLRDLCDIEGQNIAIEYWWAEGRDDRLHGLVAELVQPNVDMIVTRGSQATRAAQHADI